MTAFRPSLTRSFRASLLGVSLIALGLGGCMTRDPQATGSVSATAGAKSSGVATPRSQDEWRRVANEWSALYDKNPDDPTTALNYAAALRGLDQRAQAVAVLQRISIKYPKQPAVLAAYGRALADAGRLDEALKVLERAHRPDQPDWRILNAQGAILDQMGKFEDARDYYETALKSAPEEPSILSNLGLSYALSEKLPEAEEILRRANASPRATPKVRQNLALVLCVQGKFKEAEDVARKDLSPEDAAANIAYWRKALSQPDKWKALSGGAPPKQG